MFKMKMDYLRRLRRGPPGDSLTHEVVKHKRSFKVIRGSLMAFSLIGVILAFFINDFGSNPQCVLHMSDVRLYYTILSIILMLYFCLHFWNSATCMPFTTLTMALFHYFSTLSNLVTFFVFLFIGSQKCEIFPSENPIPLIGSCILAFMCFMCNMGIAFHIHLRQQETTPREYRTPPRVKLIRVPGETWQDSYF